MEVRNEQHAVGAKEEYEHKVSAMEGELQLAHEKLNQLSREANQGAQQAIRFPPLSCHSFDRSLGFLGYVATLIKHSRAPVMWQPVNQPDWQ